MQRIAEASGTNEELAKQIQAKTVKPVADKHHELLDKLEHDTQDEDAILRQFEDYGTMEKEPVQMSLDDLEKE